MDIEAVILVDKLDAQHQVWYRGSLRQQIRAPHRPRATAPPSITSPDLRRFCVARPPTITVQSSNEPAIASQTRRNIDIEDEDGKDSQGVGDMDDIDTQNTPTIKEPNWLTKLQSRLPSGRSTGTVPSRKTRQRNVGKALNIRSRIRSSISVNLTTAEQSRPNTTNLPDNRALINTDTEDDGGDDLLGSRKSRRTSEGLGGHEGSQPKTIRYRKRLTPPEDDNTSITTTVASTNKELNSHIPTSHDTTPRPKKKSRANREDDRVS